MMDWFQRTTYEAPGTVFLGPIAAGLLAGFAEVVGGQFYLTAAGERYLASLDQHREAAA